MDFGRHVSLWLDAAPEPERPSFRGSARYDVAVIGAGITGITTALLLCREGKSVVVLERDRVCAGTSGHTTAKITSQHGLTYAALRLIHGAGVARAYAEANEAAKERIAALAGEGIACGFRRRSAYLYADTWWQRALVELEAEAAADAKLPATLVEATPLPYRVHGAVRFDNQAEFHPARYVLGLTRLLEEAGGRVHERTPVLQVHGGRPCTVETPDGAVRADDVVVATLLPFLDRGGFFTRAFPSRSYVITARLRGPPPDGMFINAGSPIRSIRSHHDDGEDLLLVGGEGHRVGSERAQPERFRVLADFALRHWTVRAFEHHWSTQDYTTADRLPYVGHLNPLNRHIHVATGFRKWGMTGGTLAAMLITDAILGLRNDWTPVFSSTRVRPLQAGLRFTLENARAGILFVGDRVDVPPRPIEDLAPGEGGIVLAGREKVAAYRDADGRTHAVSPRCTHLSCQVRWNAAETTWDCPCHGSRFSVDGDVLNGPAVRPLPCRATADRARAGAGASTKSLG